MFSAVATHRCTVFLRCQGRELLCSSAASVASVQHPVHELLAEGCGWLRMGGSGGSSDDVDIFRDTPVRYLGYTNEVGEAFRGVIPNKLVTASYGIASLYVLADAGSKAAHAWKTHDEKLRNKEAIKYGVDVLIWQTFASILIPGFTINRLCAVARHFLVRSPLCRVAKPLTVAVGLSSIPFIIQPIDKAVDYAMDEAVRPYLRKL